MLNSIVEAADIVLARPNIHPVTRNFPQFSEVIVQKRDWWRDEVHTIAAEDQYKNVRDIMKLGWVEYREAEEASVSDKLVELGDIVVFLAAAVSREMLPHAHESVSVAREVSKQSSFLAHYVFGELEKLDVPNAYDQMVDQVFSKIRRNFPKQLNPIIPKNASRSGVATVYQSSYLASRSLRKYAKEVKGLNIANTGLPKEWSTVYTASAKLPDHLTDVREVTLTQMQTIGRTYLESFGPDSMPMLKDYWEMTAPAMVGDLAEVLVV